MSFYLTLWAQARNSQWEYLMVPGCKETVFRNFCLNQLHVKRKKMEKKRPCYSTGKKKKKRSVIALEN